MLITTGSKYSQSPTITPPIKIVCRECHHKKTLDLDGMLTPSKKVHGGELDVVYYRDESQIRNGEAYS
jgi:hypothetical protein